jgi:hypothetical protein
LTELLFVRAVAVAYVRAALFPAASFMVPELRDMVEAMELYVLLSAVVSKIKKLKVRVVVPEPEA